MSYKFAPGFLFNVFTPLYDGICFLTGLGEPLQKRVLNYAQIDEGDHILDIGCGSGTFVVMAKKKHPKSKVIGADPDENMLKVTKRKLQKHGLDVRLIKTTAEELPFQNSSFNVVVSTLTFHHLPTDIKKAALREIFRVLKKKGRFLLADITKPKSFLEKILLLANPERVFLKNYLADNISGRLPQFLEEVGFSVDEAGSRYRGVQFIMATKNS